MRLSLGFIVKQRRVSERLFAKLQQMRQAVSSMAQKLTEHIPSGCGRIAMSQTLSSFSGWFRDGFRGILAVG
ncbi:MAG: hypothetical protein RL215_1937 [Planctomycetota bacterium]|jgi:hypothetical protein